MIYMRFFAVLSFSQFFLSEAVLGIWNRVTVLICKGWDSISRCEGDSDKQHLFRYEIQFQGALLRSALMVFVFAFTCWLKLFVYWHRFLRSPVVNFISQHIVSYAPNEFFFFFFGLQNAYEGHLWKKLMNHIG